MKPVVEKLSADELRGWGVFAWPVWTKEISSFDWSYDISEQCYFLEGKVLLQTDEGKYEFGKGDFVTFPKGMKCVWNVQIPVKKHYRFD